MTDDRTAADLAGELKRHVQRRGAVLRTTRAPSPKAAPAASPTPRDATPTAPSRPAPVPPPAVVPTEPAPTTDKGRALAALREEIGDCRLCPLGASRIKLVYGVGNPDARVMFVGEGPGFSEDRQAEPFVGRAGQLLDKILEATGLSRKPMTPDWNWVYIANMVKCHPMVDPANRDKHGNDRPPTPEEMAVCAPFLMRQIRIIRPLFLVALGATAGKALLKTDRGISTFRGQWQDFSPEGEPSLRIRLLPTYHPAALLRNPNLKKDVWEDMKSLRAELNRAVA
jgi:DNA polymerase